MTTRNGLPAILVALLAVAAPACSDYRVMESSNEEKTLEACTDKADNDEDGAIDCADADCQSFVVCIEEGEASCRDGVDNDADKQIDCADPSCAAACEEATEEACHDGKDNDQDSHTDCADPTCAARCFENTRASCYDTLDNDQDGLADCADPGCAEFLKDDPNNCGACGRLCAEPGRIASCVNGTCQTGCPVGFFDLNGQPEDGCEYHCPQATPSAEVCDEVDNDCDGLADEDLDLNTDPNNCGRCGVVCGTATGGLCCEGFCRDADPQNCGACGHACEAGMLLVNELMIDPNDPTDTQSEWFEVYNPNLWDIDLRGFQLKDLGGDRHTISSATPVNVPAGGFAVLGPNANLASNGGIPLAYQYSNFYLGNSGTDEVIVVAHGVELDRVTWAAADFQRGKSRELAVNRRTVTANDETFNWCAGATPIGSGADADLGTPNAENVCQK